MENEADWAWLPYELVDIVLNKLAFLLDDYVRFSFVCKNWQFVTLHNKKQRCISNASNPQHQLPMLLVPTKDGNPHQRSLYSITNNQLCNLQLKVPFNMRACGSSLGWLAFVDDFFIITLFNPLSGVTLQQPSMNIRSENFPGYAAYRISKVMLTADPLKFPDSYELAVIYEDLFYVAIYRAIDKSWFLLPDDDIRMLVDIICYKNNIYAIDRWNGLVRIDFANKDNEKSSNWCPKLNIIISRSLRKRYIGKMYMVESITTGDLLSIRRVCVAKDHYMQVVTKEFHVYKFVQEDSDSDSAEWVEVKSLKDEALFLGDNHSISVSTLQYPECKSNCIYFSDDGYVFSFYEYFGPRDCGIFDLKTREISSHYMPDPLQKDLPPPLWIVPTLHDIVNDYS